MRTVRAQSTDTASRRKLTSTGLPADLVQRGATQLCWIGGITAVMVSSVWLAEFLLHPELVHGQHWLLAANSAVLVLVSISLAVTSRMGLVPATTLVWLSVVYEIGGAFSVAMFEHVLPWGTQVPERGISTVAAWIAVCGLLLPQTPLRSLLTGVAAAAMGPLAHYLLCALLGHAPAPGSVLHW